MRRLCKNVEAIDVSNNELTDSSYKGSVPLWIRDKTISQSDTNFQGSPVRYWADFLLSLTLAYLAMIYLLAPLALWQQIVAFPIAVLALQAGLADS